MTFEGNEKQLPIKGISRVGADNICEDGSMNEVIGLEYKDGSYIPYAGEENSTRLISDKVTKILVHKTTFIDNGVVQVNDVLLTDTQFVYWRKQGEQSFTKFNDITNAKDIEVVGNMLCVSKTNDVIQYYIFGGILNGSQLVGGYTKRNNVLTLPKVSFRVDAGLYNKNLQDVLGISKVVRFTTTEDTQDKIAELDRVTSALLAARGEARDKGGLTGFFFATYAYRLTNGEYVKASAPILLCKPMFRYDGKYYNKRTDSDVYRWYTSSQAYTEETPTDNSNIRIRTSFYNSDNNKEVDEIHYIKEHNFGSNEDPLTLYYLENGGTLTSGIYSCGQILVYSENGLRTIEGSGGQLFYVYLPGYKDSSQTPTYYSPIGTPQTYIPSYACDFDTYENPNDDTQHMFTSFVACNKLQFKIDSALGDNPDIESLCLFISQEIDPFLDFDKNTVKANTKSWACYTGIIGGKEYGTTYFVKKKTHDSIVEELENVKSLYKVLEIKKEDIVASADWINVDLEGKLGDNLVVRDQLPLSAFDYTETFGANLTSYNLRLHQYNYSQKLFRGFLYDQFRHQGGFGQYPVTTRNIAGNIYKWAIQFTIKDDAGNTKLATYDNIGVQQFHESLSPFIFYPSKNVESVTVLVMRVSGSIWLGSFSSPMRYNDSLNLSYCHTSDLKPIDGDMFTPVSPIIGRVTDITAYINNINDERYYQNGLKVSDVAYPTYFPTEFTYRIGGASIIGLARMSMSLSQDNFGRYPVLVFCTDGIYSLDVDTTGSGAYTSQAPFSREVCVNKNTICEVDGIVLFASDKGLMIASSNGVEEFIPSLNGMPRNLPQDSVSSRGEGLNTYKQIINHNQMVELTDAISKEDFIDYLHDSDTVVSYVSKKDKVIVYNKNRDFVYWIDIKTHNTTKLNYAIDIDNNNYPDETYYHKNVNNNYTTIHFGYRCNEKVNNNFVECMFQTRPIKVSMGLKTTYRVELLGEFKNDDYIVTNGSGSKKYYYAELVVLGSLDAIHWKTIGVKEKKLFGGFNNIGCVTDRVSYNYIMILFSAKLDPSSHIDNIVLTDVAKYNNKLKI